MRGIARFRSEGALTAMALVLALGVSLFQVFYYFTRVVDDLFISLRYAENVVISGRLTYNAGERVEGFSSPLWLCLQAIGLWVGCEGVLWTKLLALGSYAALLWLVHATLRRALGVSPGWSAFGLLLLAANSYLAAWTLLGLETPLFLALLVAWPLSLQAFAQTSTTQNLLQASACGLALATVRPEAPLYLWVLWGTALIEVPHNAGSPRRLLWTRAQRLALVGAIVGGSMLTLLLGRFLYFGLWLPHTYYAKQGVGFSLSKLAPLFGQGSSLPEQIFLGAALVGAARLAAKRQPVPLAVILSNLIFVAAVAEDWMPNHRHLLPTWVFGTIALLGSGAPSGRSHGFWVWLGAPVLALVGLLTALHQVTLDSRFSLAEYRTHGRGRDWKRPKGETALRDAWEMLRRRAPPHLRRMPVHALGMIQQLFRVIEAAPGSEADEWYVGRDIGKVGYYSPVRIFDTDALFTPVVARDPAWQARGDVSRDLGRRALALRPIAGEVYGDWSEALAQALAEGDPAYEIVIGSRARPIAFVRRGATPPPEVILQRYARVAAKLPQWFYLSTLYGECVGAAVDKRHAFVEEQLSRRDGFTVSEVPAGLFSTPVILDSVVRLHGCRLSSSVVRAGEGSLLQCYFEAIERIPTRYQVFVHLVDAHGRHVFSADHEPCGGFCPTPGWAPKRILEDRVWIEVPPGMRPGTLTAYVGLFAGNHRAEAAADPHVDPARGTLSGRLDVR